MISRDDVRTSNHIPQLLMAAFQNDNCIVIRNKGLKPFEERIKIILAVLIITVGIRIVVVISDAGNTAKRTKSKDSIVIVVLFFCVIPYTSFALSHVWRSRYPLCVKVYSEIR